MDTLQSLKKLFSESGNQDAVLTDSQSLEKYGNDWTSVYQPDPLAVVLPKSTDEVADLVKLANRQQFALVPSGGRTGLSGGAVAKNKEVVVSFERMNRILEFHELDNTVVCEAGVITAQLQQFADEHGLMYPVDFASSGSSQIGGNIATNAGGIKVIRYGLTRNWVLGLTVVTGKGDILELNNGLQKNATGYDLRHLFIGSEGTLGLITEATLRLTKVPQKPTVMVLGIDNVDAIMEVFLQFSRSVELSAFECFSDGTLVHVINATGLNRPFDSATAFYVLIEFDNTHEEVEAQALDAFSACSEKGWVADGVMSQSSQQARDLWRLREDISESIAKFKPYKNDLAVTISNIPAFLQALEKMVAKRYADYEVLWYGHIGDGNLHLNILKPVQMDVQAFKKVCEAVNGEVFQLVKKLRGSISAEHGVGLLKRDYLDYTHCEDTIEYMRAIKAIFDPNGILNPGKLLR